MRLSVTLLAFAACLASESFAQSQSIKIVVIAGEDAVNVIQQKTAVAPIVEVRDRNNLPVAGATVVFTLNGSNATFAGAQTLTVVTNAAGQAAAASLTPASAGALRISATATFQGQTATTTIAQSNVMTAAEAAQTANAGRAASSGGISTGKVIAIVGGIGAAGAGVAVAAGGSKSDASTSTTTPTTTPSTTGTTPTTTTGSTPTTPTPTAPAPDPNRAPVITSASVTPNVALVGIDTPIALQVQASDADNDQLTYLWEFPDGTRSDQRAFSRTFQLGGTWRIRVTVSDGKTSASSELSLNMKTITGSWDVKRTDGTALTNIQTMVFSQNGSSISGVHASSDSSTSCPLSGSIRPNEPQLVFDVPECPKTLNGRPTTQFANVYELRMIDTDTFEGPTRIPRLGLSAIVTIRRQ